LADDDETAAVTTPADDDSHSQTRTIYLPPFFITFDIVIPTMH